MENEQNSLNKTYETVGEPEHGTIADNIGAGAKGMADRASDKIKAAGIDADGAIETAEQRVTDFPAILIKEIRDRPLRALGWAVGAGFVLGILSAR